MTLQVFFHFEIHLILLLGLNCNCLNIDTHELDRPGKNLCTNHHQDVNCSNQITSEIYHTSCLMKYLNSTSPACSESEFMGDPESSEEYGTVNLTPYAWFDSGIIFPAFNITFRNIKWERLKFRFAKVGETRARICRELVVSGEVNPSQVISFDCLWGDGATEEEFFRFQYVLATKDGRRLLHTYLLQVPKDSDVESNRAPEHFRMFTMMDQTTFPQISAKVLVPPARLNVSSVNITLLYQQDLASKVTELEKWTVDVRDGQEEDFITAGMFDTEHSPGYYQFRTSFYSSFCKNQCLTSFTPHLQIPGSRKNTQIILATIIVVFSVVGLLVYFVWRNKYKNIIEGPSSLPNVLFVYEPSYPSHIENIYKFREYLQDNCYINPKMDLIDIPKTDSMNPWQWYYKAFEEADYVLVFVSPGENTEKGVHEDNVYHNLHSYALKLLIVYLLHKQKPKFSVASVKLPGCSWKTLPPVAQIIDRRFSLTEELSQMFKFLNIPPVKSGSSLLITALQQPRSPPQLLVSRPVIPLKLPFGAGDFDLDSEDQEDDIKQPIVLRGFPIKMDGHSSSEEDEEFVDQNLPIAGFKF